MNKIVVEKFLNNDCTPGEARRVLDWFNTGEGEQYLKQRFEEDSRLLEDERLKHLIPVVDSQKMWSQIERETSSTPNMHSNRNPGFSLWHVAAALLIIAATSVFYLLNQDSFAQQEENKQPIHYITGQNQHQKLKLGDGTSIRLNSNSQLWISEDFNKGKREVRLEGEAYFEVPHDEERPFVISTGKATVKDLGTAFNVKANPGENNVQVAVTEGKVSVWPENQSENEARELEKGQYGYLDLDRQTFAVDEFGVSNYLSWIDGRFKFDKAPLGKVCEQLNRIYGVSFDYEKNSLKQRFLTSDFERDSLSKVLDVIALTLDISYKKKQDEVIWLSRKYDK